MGDGDGHTALDREILGSVQQVQFDAALIKLIHGKGRFQYTLHLSAGNVHDMSGGLVGGDVLGMLPLQPSPCVFNSTGYCGWTTVGEDADIKVISSAVSSAIATLHYADRAMQRLAMQLPRAPSEEPRRVLNPELLRCVGDGHRGEDVQRWPGRGHEDDLFSYRLTYLRRLRGDGGWITHLIPKDTLAAQQVAALALVRFERFEECAENGFEPCFWRSISNPFADNETGAARLAERPVDVAWRAYDALPNVLPQLLDKIVEAHDALAAIGLPYLRPTTQVPLRRNPPSELFIPEGAPYDAFRAIHTILQGAHRRLAIVDPYVDEETAELLEPIPSNVVIELLTSKIQGSGRLAFQALAHQRGNVAVRQASTFHDRFIEVDGAFYHVGASIKDAGKRAMMLSRVEDATEAAKLRQQWLNAWAAAAVVI